MTRKRCDLSSKEGATHANGEGEGDEDDKDRGDTGDKGQWAAETPAESGEDEVLESRLWVLEISPTGLIDTPRPSNVSEIRTLYSEALYALGEFVTIWAALVLKMFCAERQSAERLGRRFVV